MYVYVCVCVGLFVIYRAITAESQRRKSTGHALARHFHLTIYFLMESNNIYYISLYIYVYVHIYIFVTTFCVLLELLQARFFSRSYLIIYVIDYVYVTYFTIIYNIIKI